MLRPAGGRSSSGSPATPRADTALVAHDPHSSGGSGPPNSRHPGMRLPQTVHNCDPDKLRPSMTCAAIGSGSGEVFDPDHRGTQLKPGEVAFRGLVVAGRDTPPRLELVDHGLDGVSLWSSASMSTGRPPLRPFLFRLAAWSRFSGMTALMPRLRRWARLPRDVLSPATASGRVRGRPTRHRTRRAFPATARPSETATSPPRTAAAAAPGTGHTRRSAGTAR